MQTELGRRLGIDLPLFAFSYQPEVVAAVSREGGLGVLGAVRFSTDELRDALDYLDRECAGNRYGVDIVMPASSLSDDRAGEFDAAQLETQLRAMIPDEHWALVESILDEYGVPQLPEEERPDRLLLGWTDTTARPQVELAMSRDIALLVNALGPPPKDIVDAAHDRDIPVAALVGRADQAVKQEEIGVDIIVAQGTEAGGHTGEIATMVLVPEVVDAVRPDTPVLAAGGIGRGSQMAAALALGAAGAWTGSIWLDAEEHGTAPVLRQKMHDATSSDTVRSRALTGKPARQLKTPWIDAWEDPGNPDPLGMPLQYMLNSEATMRMRAAGSEALMGTPVGQIVGHMNETLPVAEIIRRLRQEFAEANDRIARAAGASTPA